MSWSLKDLSDSVNCPKCGFLISSGAGFGMTTCPSCSEVFLAGAASFEPAVDSPPAPDLAPATENSVTDSQVDPLAEHKFESGGQTSEPRNLIIEQPGVHEMIRESENPKSENPTTLYEDVAQFGNQVLPSTSLGGLIYTVKVSGINTIELRKSVEEVLGESRFGVNAKEVLGQIKQGEMVVKELNPVKASVLVSRLKHLPLKISWTALQLVKAMLILVPGTFFVSSVSTPALAAEWGQHEVNLKGYQIKINTGEEELRDLIGKKNKNKDPVVRDELLKEIIKKSEVLRSMVRELKKEEEHIRFQHPEKGDQTIRKYRHLRLHSIEELENEVGIEGQLSRVKNKVKAKYDPEVKD